MDYLDLTLRLDTGEGGALVVRLVDSPAGQAEAPFVLPEIEEEVERAAEGFERLLDAEEPYRDVSPQRSLAGERQRRIGDQLFRALFPEPIRDLYNRSLGHLGSDPDLGLRIKLQMSLGDPRLAAAHGLPWECLYRAQDGTFLGRDRRTSIVRYLDLPQPGGRPSLKDPLRVLVVTARPRDHRPLPHLERERSALLELGRRRSGLEVVPLATPTLEALRNELLAGGFHVLHFLGHGAFDAATGEGLLFLEDGAGGSAPVSGPLLADLLRDITSLRLVVLNACQTARAAAPGAFGGVATALLRAGLPAVVAMQFPISDRAASTFGAALYSRLALGDPIDAAVAEGRLTIRRDLPDSAEWATPALFLRAPDGRLFEPRRRKRKPLAAAALAAIVLGLAASLFLLQPGMRTQNRPDIGHDTNTRKDRATPPAPEIKKATPTPLPVEPQAGAATPREERAPDPPAKRPTPPTSPTPDGEEEPEGGCDSIPEKYQKQMYGSVLHTLENRCDRLLTYYEQIFMVGLAYDLVSRCSLPADVAARLKIEDFVNLSKEVVAMGAEYATGTLSEGLQNQQSSQTAFRAGTLTAQAIKCDDRRARRLAEGVVDYLDRTGSATTWVKGCVNFYSGMYTEAQCQCVADIARVVSPGIHRQEFSREDIAQLAKANPFLSLKLMVKCQIGRY